MATKDTDWFNSDSTYRGAAGMEQANLYDTLSNIMYERGNKYRDIDNARREWGINRNKSGQQTAEGMAARGMLQSGAYKTNLDQQMTQYEKENADINTAEQDLVQQYGARDSMANQTFAMDSIADKNYTALASIYGLLGARGVNAGNQYNAKLGQLRGESAGRSNERLQNTLGW